MILAFLLACQPDPRAEEPLEGSVVVEPTTEISTVVVVDSAEPTETEEPVVESMYGFSFVDDVAAGAPRPGRFAALPDDLAFVAAEGITTVISLTMVPIDADATDAAGLELVHIPIEDFHAPTLPQQLELVSVLGQARERGERVLVHCTAGLGRTGTMLATWFVAEGLSSEAAIEKIRSERPGSIETADQLDSIHRFAEQLER